VKVVKTVYSVDFRFRPDSTDKERAAVMEDLRGTYPVVGGAAGVENAFFHVQPGGSYYAMVRSLGDAETLAEDIRAKTCIESGSVEINPLEE
jgi:hypothetical protein